MSQEEKDQNGGDNNKVLKSFDQTIQKLTAIVQGPNNLKPIRKVSKSATTDLVQELFKEEHEAIAKQVKEELKSLLKGYATLNNELANERKKLDAIEIAKKKQFNADAVKLFSKLEGIDDTVKDYLSAFTAAEIAVKDGPESN